jgi:plastocyanin
VGCGGATKHAAAKHPAAGPTGTVVQVKETEYKFHPASVKLRKGGAFSFKAVNSGKIGHSLEVEGNGIEKRIPGAIKPGASNTLNVTLKPGTYVWYCPIDRHKALGMKGTITVGPGSAAKSPSSSKGGGAGKSSSGTGY